MYYTHTTATLVVCILSSSNTTTSRSNKTEKLAQTSVRLSSILSILSDTWEIWHQGQKWYWPSS